MHPSDGLGHTISALLEENRIRPSHILYAPNIVACYRLVAAGMGDHLRYSLFYSLHLAWGQSWSSPSFYRHGL